MRNDGEESFLKFISWNTTSDERSESCPSTERQKYLGREMKEFGIQDAEMDSYGYVYGCFIGWGTDRFDLKRFDTSYAYTVDGGALGELEYENFNTASGPVTAYGINAHPGSAKNKMKPSLLIAIESLYASAGRNPGQNRRLRRFFPSKPLARQSGTDGDGLSDPDP